MEMWLDAHRGQVVLHSPTFGRQVCPKLWWTSRGSATQQTLSSTLLPGRIHHVHGCRHPCSSPCIQRIRPASRPCRPF